MAPNQIQLPPMVIHHPLWIFKRISKCNSNKASANGWSNGSMTSQDGACGWWAQGPGPLLPSSMTHPIYLLRFIALQGPHSPLLIPQSPSWREGPLKIPVRQLISLFYNSEHWENQSSANSAGDVWIKIELGQSEKTPTLCGGVGIDSNPRCATT